MACGVLNRLWLGYVLTAAVAALAQWLIGGHVEVFAAVVAALFDMAELSVKAMLLFGAQILFLVLNASSLMLLPVTVLMYRAQVGAHVSILMFPSILLANSAFTLAGFLSVAFIQKSRLRDPVVLAGMGGMAVLLGGFMALLSRKMVASLASIGAFYWFFS